MTPVETLNASVSVRIFDPYAMIADGPGGLRGVAAALPHHGVAFDTVISLAQANPFKAVGFVPGRTERAGRGGQKDVLSHQRRPEP